MSQKPNNQKSETLRQRDKARKDFLELKKMQQQSEDEKQAEHVPYSGEIKPDNFYKKVEHSFYYYGKITIACVLGLVVACIAVVSCFNRDNPDLRIVLYDAQIVPDIYLENIEEYFEKICPDYNNDGEVIVSVINCTYGAGKSTAQYQLNQQQKLQTLIAADDECMLFVAGQMGYDYIMSSSGVLEQEGILLPESYYAQCQDYDNVILPGGVSIYLKKIEGTNMANDSDSKANHKNAKDFMNRLKEAVALEMQPTVEE